MPTFPLQLPADGYGIEVYSGGAVRNHGLLRDGDIARRWATNKDAADHAATLPAFRKPRIIDFATVQLVAHGDLGGYKLAPKAEATHYHDWVEEYREDYEAYWFRCDCGQRMSVPR